MMIVLALFLFVSVALNIKMYWSHKETKKYFLRRLKQKDLIITGTPELTLVLDGHDDIKAQVPDARPEALQHFLVDNHRIQKCVTSIKLDLGLKQSDLSLARLDKKTYSLKLNVSNEKLDLERVKQCFDELDEHSRYLQDGHDIRLLKSYGDKNKH